MADENLNQSADQTAQQAPTDAATPATPVVSSTTPSVGDVTITATDTAPAATAPTEAAPAPAAAPATKIPSFNFPPAATKPVAKQEVKPVQQAAVKPVTKPVVQQTAAPAAQVAAVDTAAIVAKAQAEASTTGKIILQQVADYMTAMAPRKMVSVDAGARFQVGLYRTITRMINTLDDDFDLVFTAVLRLFADNLDGVFHETHVFRFMEHVPLSKDEITAFQRLLNLFINVADPKGRAAGLKMTDFNKTLQLGLTDAGRSRVLTYFNK